MWLWSNVFLNTSVCCHICDLGIPRKQHTWKNRKSSTDFTLHWNEKLRKLLNYFKQLLECRQLEKHKLLNGFLSSKVMRCQFRMLNAGEVHQWATMMKMLNKWRNLSSNTEESLSLKLLTCCLCHVGQLSRSGKRIWKCIILLPILCQTCWLVVSVCKFLAKTQLPSFHTPCTHQTYSHVTYLFS